MEITKKQLSLINSEDNRVLMTLCLNLTMFFKGGYKKEKRQAILSMFAEYQQMMKGKLNFTTNPETGYWKNLRKKSYKTPNEWLWDMRENQRWEFRYHGGKHHRDASDIKFSVLGQSDRREKIGRLSWVTVNFPLTFFAEYKESFQDVVLRWIDLLQPQNGNAAIATTSNHYDYQHEPHEYQLALQYPGLDISDHISLGLYLKQNIKGVNWLTIIQQTSLDVVGGVEKLKSIEGIQVWKEGNVYMIQASNKPVLEHIPSSYYQLGELLEPIRDKTPYNPHHQMEEELTFSKESYAKWLARFDKKPDKNFKK